MSAGLTPGFQVLERKKICWGFVVPVSFPSLRIKEKIDHRKGWSVIRLPTMTPNQVRNISYMHKINSVHNSKVLIGQQRSSVHIYSWENVEGGSNLPQEKDLAMNQSYKRQ